MANTLRYRRPQTERPVRTMKVRLAVMVNDAEWQVLRDMDLDRLIERRKQSVSSTQND